MTVTQPAQPVCPACGGTNTMILSDGMARCFDDQHEWNPAEVTAIAARPAPVPDVPAVPSVGKSDGDGGPIIPPFQMATVEEVFGPPPGITEWERGMTDDALIGGTARLEGGQFGTVVAFTDNELVVIRLNDGRLESVPLNDVERITPRAPDFAVDVAPEPDAVTAEWITDAVMLSDLIIAAGLATIYETADGLSVGKPPDGWLPRDASTNALIEAAAAVAVARLVVAYEIDVDDVASGLRTVRPEPQEGDQQGDEQ